MGTGKYAEKGLSRNELGWKGGGEYPRCCILYLVLVLCDVEDKEMGRRGKGGLEMV